MSSLHWQTLLVSRGFRDTKMEVPVFFAASLSYIVFFVLRKEVTSSSLSWVGYVALGALLKSAPVVSLSLVVSRSASRLPSSFSSYVTHLELGLLLSAGGDFFLHICDAGWEPGFIVGLGLFFLAHCAYVYGFFTTRGRHEVVLALASAAMPVAVLSSVMPHVLAAPATAHLAPALAVYCGAIALMLYGAVVRRTDAIAHRGAASANWHLTVGGAALFIFSDACLAFDRFAPPPRNEAGSVRWWWRCPQLLVLVSYYAAQALLAYGAWRGGDAAPATASARAQTVQPSPGRAPAPAKRRRGSPSPARKAPAPASAERKAASKSRSRSRSRKA
jgi:uncharacterized membrane protein YhhN